jgi:hypothetical protein
MERRLGPFRRHKGGNIAFVLIVHRWALHLGTLRSTSIAGSRSRFFPLC